MESPGHDQKQLDFERGWQTQMLNRIRLPKTNGVSPGYLVQTLKAIYGFAYRHGECWASGEKILHRMGRISPEVEQLPEEERTKRIRGLLRQLGRSIKALSEKLSVITCDLKKGAGGVVTNHHRVVWSELRRFDPEAIEPQTQDESAARSELPTTGERCDMVSRPMRHGVATDATWCRPSINRKPEESNYTSGEKEISSPVSGEIRMRARTIANRISNEVNLRIGNDRDIEFVTQVAFAVTDGLLSEDDLESALEGLRLLRRREPVAHPCRYLFRRLSTAVGDASELNRILRQYPTPRRNHNTADA